MPPHLQVSAGPRDAFSPSNVHLSWVTSSCYISRCSGLEKEEWTSPLRELTQSPSLSYSRKEKQDLSVFKALTQNQNSSLVNNHFLWRNFSFCVCFLLDFMLVALDYNLLRLGSMGEQIYSFFFLNNQKRDFFKHPLKFGWSHRSHGSDYCVWAFWSRHRNSPELVIQQRSWVLCPPSHSSETINRGDTATLASLRPRFHTMSFIQLWLNKKWRGDMHLGFETEGKPH